MPTKIFLHSPILVGIVGPSGSGKTTLCKKLKLSSGQYEHIRLDNYFKPPRTFPLKYGFRNWEKPSNLKFAVLLKDMKTLKSGKAVHTKSFPKKAGDKPEALALQPRPVILVEGFMLFKNKPVRGLLDVKIYLDIPAEAMLKRRAIRFGENHVNDYDTKVAIPEFLKYGVVQKKYADHVIDATKSQAEVFRNVKKIISTSSKNYNF